MSVLEWVRAYMSGRADMQVTASTHVCVCVCGHVCVCTRGLSPTKGHQLGTGQVIESELILKQFGELQDLLCAGLFPRGSDLSTQRTRKK